MAIEFTPEQRQAIDSRGGSLIVSAAAGSGKTAVLVRRVLERITRDENPVDIDQMLIVTFTNAAASEMRERIAASLLEQLAEQPQSRRLRKQLALLDTARIQTVHAFCLDLVRQNFTQCNVAPGFRLLDTAEGELLKEQAMEEMLEEQYAPPQHPDFIAALENFAEERGDKRLQRVVLNLYEQLRSHTDPASWLEGMIAQAQNGAQSPGEQPWCAGLLAHCQQQMEYHTGRLQGAYEQLAEQPDVLEKYGPAFEHCLAAGRQIAQAAGQGWDACYSALGEFAPLRLNAVRGGDKEFTDRMKAARDEFCQGVAELRKSAITRPSGQIAQELAQSLPILRGLRDLVQAFEQQYQQLKNQRNALDFSDLEHLAIDLLWDRVGDCPTDLADQVAQGIREILVDEYQDTNQIQDTLFRALKREGNSLFMVGDVKQSIYRFRLAEPQLFVEKYYTYTDYSENPQAPCKRVSLNQNFRSRREVLSFANFLCSRLMRRQFGGVEYDESEALRPGAQYQGLCPTEVYLLDMLRDEEDDVKRALYEAEFAAETIGRQLAETQVTGEDGALRPAKPEDVAVLLSSFTSRAPLYQQALARRGIPSSAGGGGDLFATIEIAVVRSMLAIIDNPRQDIPLVSVLRSPLYLFTPDELLTIRQQCGGDFYDALAQSDSPRVQDFMEQLAEFRQLAPDMTIGQLVAHIYSRTGALGVFQALDGGELRRRNLERFYQMALQQESSGSLGLFGFLRTLEKRAQEGAVADEPSPGSVRLMSMHKSKGLEFPIVLVPDLSKAFNADDVRQPMLLHKELGLGFALRDLQRRTETKTQLQLAIALRHTWESREEELRKLYVAMTRAREKLICTLSVRNATTALAQWDGLLQEDGTLPLAAVASQSSAAAWLVAPLLRHPEGGQLREYGGLPPALPLADGMAGGLYCRALPFDMALLQPQEGEESKQAPLEQLTLDMPKFRQLQDFVYPHLEATLLPSKLTPTGLQALLPDSAQLEWEESGSPVVRLYPTAGREDAAQLGTLAHRCMQLVDLAHCQTPEQASQELRRLVEAGKLPQEAGAMEGAAIARFAASPLGKQAQAYPCLREYQFSALFTPAELGLPGGNQEEILMNGIIDLLILDPAGAIVVDFKSDALGPGQEEKRAQRYASQLKIYAQAVEKILERQVSSRQVYFLATGRAVECDISAQ